MVGPWQVPVADVGVSSSSYDEYTGEAMAMGERTPLALLKHSAAARMAVGEALTNLAAARIVIWKRWFCRQTGWRRPGTGAKMPACLKP